MENFPERKYSSNGMGRRVSPGMVFFLVQGDNYSPDEKFTRQKLSSTVILPLNNSFVLIVVALVKLSREIMPKGESSPDWNVRSP